MSIENGISVRRTTGCGPTGVAHQVVAIERDVERAGRHAVAVDLVQRPGEPARQRHAAGADADQRELVEPAVALEDFVGDAGQGAGHAIGVHYQRHGRLQTDRARGGMETGCSRRRRHEGDTFTTSPLGLLAGGPLKRPSMITRSNSAFYWVRLGSSGFYGVRFRRVQFRRVPFCGVVRNSLLAALRGSRPTRKDRNARVLAGDDALTHSSGSRSATPRTVVEAHVAVTPRNDIRHKCEAAARYGCARAANVRGRPLAVDVGAAGKRSAILHSAFRPRSRKMPERMDLPPTPGQVRFTFGNRS